MSPVVTVTTCAPPPVDRGEVFRYAACRRPGAEEERLLDSCLEELGLQEGWITAGHVHAIGDELSMTLYGKYLQCL